MRHKLLLLLGFALLLPPQSGPAHASKPGTPQTRYQLTVEGKLIGQTETPMAMAHVRLSTRISRAPLAGVKVGPRGAFRIQAKLAGAVQLLFFGTHHKLLMIPLVIRKDTHIKLDVRLQAKKLHRKATKLKVIGEFNTFHKTKGAISLQHVKADLYRAVIPWNKPRLRYQLQGAVQHTRGTFTGRIAGTHGDGYIATKHTIEYHSWVRTSGGKATILFAPKRLPFPQWVSAVKWHKAPASTKAMWKVFKNYLKDVDEVKGVARRIAKYYKQVYRRHMMGIPHFGQRFHPKQFGFDTPNRLRAIYKKWRRSRFPDERKILAFHLGHAYMWGMQQVPRTWQAAFCQGWKPTETLWRIRELQRMSFSLSFLPQKKRWYCIPSHDRYIKELPDIHSRINMLASTAMLMHRIRPNLRVSAYAHFHSPHDYHARLQKLYVKLQKQRAPKHTLKLVTTYIRKIHRLLYPKQLIQVGKPVPAFSIKALHPKGSKRRHRKRKRRYTHKTLRGRWTLIYFWAPWCGACMQSMPNLYRLQQKYKQKNLQILAVALEKDHFVLNLALRKYPMPWLHSIATKGFQEPLVQMFEVSSIPKLALVNPKGVVAALGNSLNKWRLDRTLARQLTLR